MGNGGIKAAVVDAGPLIHLNEIGCLQLLRIFEKFYIPDVVWSESVGQGYVSQLDVFGLGNVERHTLPESEVKRFIQENDFENLIGGECECLYLCKQKNVPILLTDDLAVREASKRLNLTPVGSLGIVVKSYRLGNILLTDAERYIDDLYRESSLFVTRTIVEIAIEQLR